MAITIVKNLSVHQDAVRLPFRIDLSQTLSSSEASERVTIEYRLGQNDDVWFSSSPNTKTVTRTETVARAATPISHRLNLVHGAGGQVERAVIRQTITDGVGIETPDETFVTILRGGGS